MEMQIVPKGLNFTRKKKKWALYIAAIGLTGYGVYKVYNLPSVVRKRKRVLRLLAALVKIVEAVSDSAETVGFVCKDLRVFLQSDSDEIPNSLKQIGKLADSKEFSDSVVGITAALTKGFCKGYQEDNGVGNGSKSGFFDRFLDRLFADSSSGFVSVVAGSFARNLVLGFYESGGDVEGKRNLDGVSWVDVMCSERGRGVIGECIQKFVSTAVAVYLEKTMNVNTYDELFAGLTNPKHEKQVRETLVALCSGSIESLVKTSHKVLTSSKSVAPAKLGPDTCDLSRFVVTRSNSDVVAKTFHPEINDARNVITVKQNGGGACFDLNGERRSSSGESWMSTVSSTLAVPSNRKLVLDVTGRVTFETVRTFLDFLVEKLVTSVKRSFHVVNEAIIDAGYEVVRYVTAKSYVITSICISLCLHVFGGTWMLMPA